MRFAHGMGFRDMEQMPRTGINARSPFQDFDNIIGVSALTVPMKTKVSRYFAIFILSIIPGARSIKREKKAHH
jgi:hypothetical protein